MQDGNVITIGGVTVDRPSGKKTIAAPLVQYVGASDDDLNEFWDEYAGNSTIQAANDTWNKSVAPELIKLGRKWNARKKD